MAADMARERERNRLLRRADWRFLLPDSSGGRVVCFARGFLGRSVAAVFDQVSTEAKSEEADLAVTLNPSGKTLAAAYRALRAGGTCYAEWYLPWPFGADYLRHRLTRAGFERAEMYWAWPSPCRGRAALWASLTSPAVQRYLLRKRPHEGTGPRRLVRSLLLFSWLLAKRLGLLIPICAIARKSPADKIGETEERMSWLLLAGGSRSTNKVVRLGFSDTTDPVGALGEAPSLAVKMARVPEASSGLLREAEILRWLAKGCRHDLLGIPDATVCARNGVVAVHESAVVGTPLYTQLNRASYRSLALAATDWLACLAGRVEPAPAAVWWDRLIEPVLADFTVMYGAVTDEASRDQAQQLLTRVTSVPLVCEQRDFSPWNVLVTPDGRLAVLDWESAEKEGMPAADLIYFLSYATFFCDGAMRTGRFEEAYRQLLDPTTPNGRVAHECFDRYCRQAGFDRELLPAIRLWCWMLHARSEYRRLAADRGEIPIPCLRRSVFLRLWKEELRWTGL
jgi:hypothetical protein